MDTEQPIRNIITHVVEHDKQYCRLLSDKKADVGQHQPAQRKSLSRNSDPPDPLVAQLKATFKSGKSRSLRQHWDQKYERISWYLQDISKHFDEDAELFVQLKEYCKSDRESEFGVPEELLAAATTGEQFLDVLQNCGLLSPVHLTYIRFLLTKASMDDYDCGALLEYLEHIQKSIQEKSIYDQIAVKHIANGAFQTEIVVHHDVTSQHALQIQSVLNQSLRIPKEKICFLGVIKIQDDDEGTMCILLFLMPKMQRKKSVPNKLYNAILQKPSWILENNVIGIHVSRDYQYVMFTCEETTEGSDLCVDLTRQPQTSGQDVINATVNQIHESGIFPDDKGFMRRIAYVESKNGADPATYRDGYFGGIWQVDEQKLAATKDVRAHPLVTEYHNKIVDKFDISWPAVEWKDLQKPLHSGMGARLYLETVDDEIPGISNIEGQATYWKKHYNTIPERNVDTFKEEVKDLGKDEESKVSTIDLAFVIDASGSVGEYGFERAKGFLINMVEKLNIGYEGTRVGVIKYDHEAHIEFDLDMLTTKESLKSAIDSISYKEDGGTATGKALIKLAEKMFSHEGAGGARKRTASVPRVAIVMTDGQSVDNVVGPADVARSLGITLFAIGIGPQVNFEELNQIANEPSDSYRFHVTDFGVIDTILYFVQTATFQASCSAELDQPITGILTAKDRRHLTFPIPGSNYITFTMDVPIGEAVLYLSTKGSPSGSYHERKLETTAGRQFAQLFLNLLVACSRGARKNNLIYVTIVNKLDSEAKFHAIAEEGYHVIPTDNPALIDERYRGRWE